MFIRLILALCTLHLFSDFSPVVNASRRPWTTADNSGPAARTTRAVNAPIPIECKLGNWSSWTPCTFCTDETFRFRYLEKPSQFGGSECIGTLWERDLCPQTTQCMVEDYCGESFTCKESGRCISQSLRCNGEPDCDDFSDEEGCETLNKRDDKCSKLLSIPGAERGTQGYNILTDEFVDHVLDPQYFGGKCEYVYNGEWRTLNYDAFCENLHFNEDEKNYRKPYNYHTFRFVAEAKSEGTQEYYEDMFNLLKAKKTRSSFNLGVTVGISKVEVGLEGSNEKSFLRNITKYNSQDLGFIRLVSKVQTAHFKMRSNQLMLHEDFYFSLMELPEEYNFGMYSRFFNTFGTHYVTEGTMGGTLEYVVIVNKTSMAESKIEGEQFGVCFGASIGLNLPFKKVTGHLKVAGKWCGKDGSFSAGQDSSSSAIKDVFSVVKGGVVESSAGIAVIKDPDTYRKWGVSLQYNPAVIEYETMPIYELVRLSTASDHVGRRLVNLERGLDEYLQQGDSCRCVPCRHNGMPLLSGTSCRCICKSGYKGEACEETHRTDTRINGAWSCWGAWSACTSEWKTRTRVCNNPAPGGGGLPCLGSSTQTWQC